MRHCDARIVRKSEVSFISLYSSAERPEKIRDL